MHVYYWSFTGALILVLQWAVLKCGLVSRSQRWFKIPAAHCHFVINLEAFVQKEVCCNSLAEDDFPCDIIEGLITR